MLFVPGSIEIEILMTIAGCKAESFIAEAIVLPGQFREFEMSI